MKIGRLGHTTGRGIHTLARAGAWVSGSAVVIMMFLTTADVFARYVIVHPIKGTLDITVLMLVVLAFLAFGYAQVTESHVSIQLVTSRLSKRMNAVLLVFTRFLSIGVYLLMSWAMGARAWEYLVIPEKAPVSELLAIPYVPFMFVAAIGIAILCLALIVDFARSVAKLIRSQ